MQSEVLTVGSTIQVTWNNTGTTMLGLIVAKTDTNITMERLMPTTPTIMDARLLSVPHVQHISSNPVQLNRTGEHVPNVQPVLVLHVMHYLNNALIFRDGMAGIYAIESRKGSDDSSVSTPIGSTEFSCYTNTTPAAEDNDLMSLLNVQQQQQQSSIGYQFYAFRHTLVEHFQKHLKSSRGRRVTGSFSFHASIENVQPLFQLLTRNGSVVSRRGGVNRPTRVLRNNSVQTLRIPKDALNVAMNDPTVLCSLLGSQYYFFPIVPPHFSVGVITGHEFVRVSVGPKAIIFEFDLLFRTLSVRFRMAVVNSAPA